MLKKKLSLLLFITTIVSILPNSFNNFKVAHASTIISSVSINEDTRNENYVWLSDLTWNPKSFTRYGSLKKDLSPGNQKITLIVDGETIQFNKGIGAHATSSVIYDVSCLTEEYTKLHGYMGVDKSMNGKGSVKFTISKSENGIDWTPLQETDILYSNNNSAKIDLDISNVKYIKLDANDAGGNGNDHAVYGDIRLLKTNYNIVSSEYSDKIKNVSEYDKELSTRGYEENITNYKINILKRELVNRIGYHTLQSFYKQSDANKEMINWLMNNQEVLELYISGGKPEGSVNKSLQVLSDLYAKHSEDTENKTYLKMMLATSIAFGQDLRLWTGSGEYANPVERYEIYKDLYDNNLLYDNKLFDNLPLELMRWVFNAQIDNDEIKWLNAYARKFGQTKNKEFEISPHPYMKYTSGYNYNRPEYYDQNNFLKYDDQFDLAKYGVKYGTLRDNKLWMVILEGAVCGGISKIGTNLRQVYGLPAAVIGQPGHAAFLVYSEDSNGKGKWAIDNNVSGWLKSEKGERAVLNWGSQSWDSYYGVSYILLAQQALNNYDEYLESMYYNLLANSYSSPEDKIKAYEEGLKAMPYHVDILVALINQYKADGKSSSDFLKLAKKASKGLAYFPLPFADIMKLIESNISSADIAEFDLIRTNTLKAATLATSNDTLQYSDCQNIAKGLLGANSVELASFSFNGENANKIVINDKYSELGIRVSYSVDGGNEWIESTDHVIEISKENIAKINSTNDIKVKLVGSNEAYIIDIKDAAAPNSNTLQANDFENELIGNINNLEFSLDNGVNWAPYTANQKIDGNTVVKVRYSANGVNLASPVSQYTFTDNLKDSKYSYISIHDIVNVKYANEQNTGSSGKNMVDGMLNTQWHTKWNMKTEDKSYTITLNEARDISAVDYVPAGVNGRFAQYKVEVSMDNENWVLAGTTGTLAKNTAVKTLKFDKSVKGQYVKITPLSTYGNTTPEVNMYASGYEFRLYEDLSAMANFVEPTIEYSTTTITNKDVTASLKISEGTIVENGNSFVFSENGEHTFNYTRPDGTKGSITAKVNWIDKIAPTATVAYDVTSDNKFIEATATIDGEGAFVDDSNGKIILDGTGSKIFRFTDEAGNIGTATAYNQVYISNNSTNYVRFTNIANPSVRLYMPVDSYVILNKNEIVVNNNNSNKYTFTENGTFVYKIKNKETGEIRFVPVKVDWIYKNTDSTQIYPNSLSILE